MVPLILSWKENKFICLEFQCALSRDCPSRHVWVRCFQVKIYFKINAELPTKNETSETSTRSFYYIHIFLVLFNCTCNNLFAKSYFIQYRRPYSLESSNLMSFKSSCSLMLCGYPCIFQKIQHLITNKLIELRDVIIELWSFELSLGKEIES